jgi:nucleoside-diphosphate-sugar epimerase
MSGLIGGAVRRQLEGRYAVSALNRRIVPGIPTLQADIADFDAIQPAFAGQDIVVHLAGYRGGDWKPILHTNVIGTYNVFEAAKRAGVGRIIYASSGATVSGWQRHEPIKSVMIGAMTELPPGFPKLTHETPIRPWSLYGCAKVWGEALARYYTETTDMSVICLRIAVVNEEDGPNSEEEELVWCSQRDVAQMVERCIQAPPELKFDIFNVVGTHHLGFRDISHAREVVGFEPQDSADSFRE